MSEHMKENSPEGSVKRLDIYYGIVKRQLLQYQSFTTGLFPVISTEEKEGSVRDSIYCAAAMWSLYQAYRRIDDDKGKSYELGQSTVKCMRGVLQCWIKQASKLELFKENQCNSHALHCKFHLYSGDSLYSELHPHLQIDVVSLFLLYLVQMISSGLQIIYTQDEVAFIQNLVYYIERAYRTPDFGIWERGTKYKNRTPEIHASSIGMAKSALEAINGCNLFGQDGASWSVIYVDIDAHNRNRSIFDSMLPRESSSKEVDAALLCTLSYPAFATHHDLLTSKTMNNVTSKLKGKYGFKRFLCDGYKTILERNEREFYPEGKTKQFENIECEWPLFFIYMIIDGIFKNRPDQTDEYRHLLESCIKTDRYGDPIIPMYYYVSADDLETERLHPGTASKCPSRIGSPGGGLFLWAQAVYIVAQLLINGLLHVNELDPIRRHQPSHSRPRKGGRYSAFQGTTTDLVVQIVLIAESRKLQALMATFGIQTQTPHQVEPVQILSSSQLVKMYENLGVNTKLGLKGRPSRPIGALGTSKIYRICGKTVLCYPLVFEVSEFYLFRDMALLIDDIKTELRFIGRNWRLSGRPTVCLLIKEDHIRDPHLKELLHFMAMLKRGDCNGTKVRIGRLQNLISSSCLEHLDFMNVYDPSNITVTQFKELEDTCIDYQSLTNFSKITEYTESLNVVKQIHLNKPLKCVIEDFQEATGLRARCQLLDVLVRMTNEQYKINDKSLKDHIKDLYFEAGVRQCWDVIRFCSSLLKHTVDSISPFITTVLVHGKQLTVGVIGHEETVFDKPMTPAEIHSIMYDKVQPHNIIYAVLQQEVVLYCGRLIVTEPQVFEGILKIRIGWLLEAIKLYLERNQNSKPLECHTPYEVRQLIHKILSVRDLDAKEKLTEFEMRQLEGCLGRVPADFYSRVWDVLNKTPQGFRVTREVIFWQSILSNTTRSELSFALLVEETIHGIKGPEYRQIIVELLDILSTVLSRYPEISFQSEIDLDHLVTEAFSLFKEDNKLEPNTDLNAFLSASRSVAKNYLSRAIINDVLQGRLILSITEENQSEGSQKNYCKIS